MYRSVNQTRKIINLKSEMRGICSCKTRFLRFFDLTKKGGAMIGVRKSPKIELVGCYV